MNALSMSDSLDDLISKKAEVFAAAIRSVAASTSKEEEIRIESEKQLAFIQKEAGIKLEGKHEYTVLADAWTRSILASSSNTRTLRVREIELDQRQTLREAKKL
jgi:hypothetical protein